MSLVAKKIIFTLFVVLILSVQSLALTWSEALFAAAQNNNQLKSMEKAVEASEWTYKKTYTVFFPQISAFARMTAYEFMTTAESKSYSYGLNVSQYILPNVGDIYNIQSSYANLEYQKANLAITKASVYYDLRKAFLDVLFLQEKIKLLSEILAKRKENTKLIGLRYDSGREDKGNYLTTQADEASAGYDLSSAKRGLTIARLKLSQLISDNILRVEEPEFLSEPTVVDFEILLKGTPSYFILEKQLKLAEVSYQASISGFLPSLSLNASYGNSGADWPPTSETRSWSLVVSIPMFPGGRNVADRIIEGKNLEKAKEDFASSVYTLRYSLEEAYLGYKDAFEAFNVAKISLNAATEREKITKTKYLNGLTTYDEWYRVENSYVQAEKNILSSKESLLLAEALWYKTYGGWKK